MRIALVTSSFLPRTGGVEEHVSHVARELRARGHVVTVWAVDQGDATPPDDDGVVIRYLPVPLPNRSLPGLLRWAVRAPRAWLAWRRAHRLDRPDVIVIQCYGPNGPWAAALAGATRMPLVYANHGETFMDADGVFDRSALLRASLRRTLRRADAVVSCSHFAADDLVRFGPSATPVVVGNGIDLAIAPSPLAADLPARYIAGVGRLVENKGFATLIDAFALAVARGGMADVDLVLAGSGPAEDALRSLAARRGVADRVHFVGTLTRPHVRALLDSALAQVVPSHVEAFGIVVLEGWRSGVPVVVTDRGGPREFVTDGVDGLLFDPFDVDELAGRLSAIRDDDELRQRLGQAGRKSAERFSWAAVSGSYEVVLRGVLGAATAP